MKNNDQKLILLKQYLANRDDVLMAFLFGSRSKGHGMAMSDWDIAVYLKPADQTIEWETERRYPAEGAIWNDAVKILETDNVDLVILNRAPSTLAASALYGRELCLKDRKTYLSFLVRVTGEAEDFREFARDYERIYWRAQSLSEPDEERLRERLIFLDAELKDIERYREFTQQEYQSNRAKKREIERWVENIVNAVIDIAKIIVASDKQPIPQTYLETVLQLGALSYLREQSAEQLASFTKLRNLLAHEYLDLRWREISAFVAKAEPMARELIEAVKKVVSAKTGAKSVFGRA